MPLMSNSRKRSRGNVEQGPGGTPLKGWDFIQEKILSHDEDMIADYADNIDTLLVFAGLFSAVLTAFLVVSLVLLQPDNSQLSVQLLSLIALQNGAPDRMQPFLNETAESLPTSTAFRAPTSAATINTLWFTSLVLSLAAALFGILAKQWCREYLRWHSVIASARENVLIRQVRFEAWERWRVASFIASIPAFLQIALILFFVGLLIFVPTLSEHGLTAVVSIVIGGVLLGTAALTLLPAFYRLCPFQSPTSWVFVLLAELSRDTSRLLMRQIFLALSGFYEKPGQGYPRWLRRLLPPRKELPTSWRAYGLRSIDHADGFAGPAVPGIKQACRDANIGDAQWPWAEVDALQTRMLSRALIWVRRGSQNEDVFLAIRDSLSSIHFDVIGSFTPTKPHFLSSAYSICPIDLTLILGFIQSSFYEASNTHLSFRSTPPDFFYHQDGPFCTFLLGWPWPPELEKYRIVACAWQRDSTSLEICHALIRLDILRLTEDWVTAHAQDDLVTRLAMAERIALLLCVLRVIPFHSPRLSVRHWASDLEEVYRTLAPYQEAFSDGLLSMCLEMSRPLGTVVFRRDNGEHRITILPQPFVCGYIECSSIDFWARFSADIYSSSDDYESSNMRHLFVVSVRKVFDIIREQPISPYSIAHGLEWPTEAVAMSELLSLMAHVLGWSLRHSIPNCGAYISLSWPKDILRCYESLPESAARDPVAFIPLTGESTIRPKFLLILRLLESCLHRGLLTGSTTAGDLRQLMTILRHPTLPELPADLTDEALAAVRKPDVPLEANGSLVATLSRDDDELAGEVVSEWSWSPVAARLGASSAHTGVETIDADGVQTGGSSDHGPSPAVGHAVERSPRCDDLVHTSRQFAEETDARSLQGSFIPLPPIDTESSLEHAMPQPRLSPARDPHLRKTNHEGSSLALYSKTSEPPMAREEHEGSKIAIHHDTFEDQRSVGAEQAETRPPAVLSVGQHIPYAGSYEAVPDMS